MIIKSVDIIVHVYTSRVTDILWYQNGVIHRDDGPGRSRSNGSWSWWKNGARHRDYGPAVRTDEGVLIFYKDDRLYQNDDDQAVINPTDKNYEYWISV